MKKISKECNWQQLRKDFHQYIESLYLGKRRLSDYSWILNRLEKFMQSRNEISYNSGIGEAFTEEMRNTLGLHSLSVILTTIRRLDDYLAEGKCTLHSPKKKPELQRNLQGHLDGYIEFCKMQGLRESTIKRNADYIRMALIYFWGRNICEPSCILPQDVYDVFMAIKSKNNLHVSLRSFFRYLYKTGKHGTDLSLFVPSVRKPQVLPSTYTKEEMRKLLESIDKTTRMGKRDYLIVLLAQKLGMRSGDIARLKYSDINRQTKTINFIQEKTLAPHQLELLPEIEEALLEHLNASNPDFGCEYIFLRVVPPYTVISPVVVSNVVQKAFKTSGICTDGKKHGPHSLRMTLASDLVSENIPYMVVSKILGHEDPNAAKHYVKFDVEMLRACALEVPQLSGHMAELLGIMEGGGNDGLYV